MTHLRLAAGSELRSEIEIKRSRFITLIRRVESEDAARQLLADAREEFPDARHHCSAFVVSVPGAQPRSHSSDDGEPSGTAGRPMLDVLTGANLVDIAAVVVRYFGGTLLGTGGLVRAYSDAVRTTLDGVAVVEPRSLSRQRVSLAHANAGKVEAELRARNYPVLDQRYVTSGVDLILAVENLDAFRRDLAEITAGAATAYDDGVEVIDVPAGQLP